MGSPRSSAKAGRESAAGESSRQPERPRPARSRRRDSGEAALSTAAESRREGGPDLAPAPALASRAPGEGRAGAAARATLPEALPRAMGAELGEGAAWEAAWSAAGA